MDIATLLAAVSSPDDATRNAAEAALSNAESTNPGAYFLALAQELKNDARDDALRQQAGLLMKVSLDSQNVRGGVGVGGATSLPRRAPSSPPPPPRPPPPLTMTITEIGSCRST